MPLQKPKGRKRASHKRAYASLAVLVLLGLSSLTYAYLNGFFPGNSTTGCPTPPTSTTGNVYACIATSQGSFEIELFKTSAPLTVANFINLSRTGFYTNLVWHRISTNPAVIQTGDPLSRDAGGDRSQWGSGGSTKTVPLEVSNSSLHNARGYLGMARNSSINSGTSQFYINTQDNLGLDTQYAVFGRVIFNGMGVVDKIAGVPTSSQYYEQPDDPSQAMLLSITILGSG